MKSKELICHLVDNTKSVEMEISNRHSNYDYSLLSLEGNGKILHFEFEDTDQITRLIESLELIKEHIKYGN